MIRYAWHSPTSFHLVNIFGIHIYLVISFDCSYLLARLKVTQSSVKSYFLAVKPTANYNIDELSQESQTNDGTDLRQLGEEAVTYCK